MTEDDPLRRVFAWLAAAATLSFATVGLANQTDPRLPGLFDRLKSAHTAEEAAAAESRIWAIWTLSGDPAIDRMMVEGLHAMTFNDYDRALALFDAMVEKAPKFAEAWNKRATVHYLRGEYAASITDIERTLALEPRHFGALSGLGLVYLAQGKEAEALKAFDRALAVHPHLAGAETHIRALREKLKGRGI